MKNIFILVAALSVASPSRAANVTFIVTPLSMPDSGPVSIAGSHPQVGDWQSIPFDRASDGTWHKTAQLDSGATIDFKITRGSWDKEALDEDLTVPGNRHLAVSGDTTLFITVFKWKDEVPGASPKIRGQVTGTVITHRNRTGAGVLPRDIHVWLPPSYDSEPAKRFPVLYMHDGQQIFDPRTSTHGVDWQIDEAVTRLAADGKMREIIVVGVNNTANRGNEYSDTADGKAYQNFLIQNVKPFIDEHYRTLSGREHTAVMGSSMGGIASFLLVWHHPDVFSMAACLSPAFFLDWDELKNPAWPIPGMPVRIYMDNGGIGLEERLQPGCDLMLEALKSKGFILGKDLLWFKDKNAEHTEAEWAKRAWMPLQYHFGIGPQNWIDQN